MKLSARADRLFRYWNFNAKQQIGGTRSTDHPQPLGCEDRQTPDGITIESVRGRSGELPPLLRGLRVL